MQGIIRSLIWSVSIILLGHSTAVFSHTDGGIVVKNPWVREAPPVSPVLAGYMTIENHTGKPNDLISVKSSAFQKIEIHKTIFKDGMAEMQNQNSLTIDAEKSVELKPGGTHLMLINPVKPLKAGDTVSFILVFSNGSKSIVSAPVKKASAKKAADQHQQSHSGHEDISDKQQSHESHKEAHEHKHSH
jgi:copper(I)-binding protein